MSKWSVVEEPSVEEPKRSAPKSPWSVVPETQTPISQQNPSPNENIFGSIASAPYRIGEDASKAFMSFLNNIPHYWDKAQTEVPGIYQTAKEHPGHLAAQIPAGMSELGQKLINLPSQIADYETNRLNLYPRKINEMIQKTKLPDDTQQMIDQTFGKAQYPGEEMLRGGFRNLDALLPGASAVRTLNPMRYTANNIAKNVLKEGERQYAYHQKQYTGLWNQAAKEGHTTVPYDPKIVNPNFDLITEGSLPKQHASMKEFQANPSVENAQKALTEMKSMKRTLEEQSRSRSLLPEEIKKYKALMESENNIEQNLFKDKSGKVNEKLAKRYNAITNSYRENVVPYKYHPQLQAYKAGELLPGELLPSLQKGKFAAQKGGNHPELFRREAMIKAMKAAGLIGGVGVGGLGGAYLGHKYLTGANENE